MDRNKQWMGKRVLEFPVKGCYNNKDYRNERE